TFDEPNLISSAGLVPVMTLAQKSGLAQLADQKISVANTGGDKGANPGAKLSSLVAGMIAGADSIDDMDFLHHCGMPSIYGQVYAPSTLGSFLREFTHGHVKQLAAVSSRFLTRLGKHSSLLPVGGSADPRDGMVYVDIDDTILEVYSPKKQGAGVGYNKTR